MQKLKLDVTKIPKERIFNGTKGKYIDLVLHDNKDGTDQYGNDGFIAVDVTKEEREAGVKGPIVGNWKHVGQKPPMTASMMTSSQIAARQKAAKPDYDATTGLPTEDDDIPF